MKARTSIFSLLLLTAATGAFGQVAPKAADPSLPRPLNLSVRKPVAPVTDPALLLLESVTPTQATQGAVVGGNEDAGAALVAPEQVALAMQAAAVAAAMDGAAPAVGVRLFINLFGVSS